MVISIRQRIYCGFLLLVSLFVLNGIITVVTLVNNQKLSDHIYKVIDPSLRSMDDFNKMLIKSKMYTTNWVFLRSSQSDKEALLKLHDSGYYELKNTLNIFASQWKNKSTVNSLDKLFSGFELLLSEEKKIITSLNKFEDYADPLIKMDAERIVEDEVLPRTTELINSLDLIISREQKIRSSEEANLKSSSRKLKILIISLAAITVCAGLFLSVYMTRIIINPINRIRHIVNELGKGIIRKIDLRANGDEIGEMIISVNKLSENLQKSASFASEVGFRNFDMPFQPLSEEDTMGKALILMRDNLKTSEKELHETTVDLLQRNSDLEQFTYIISHNLRAPVANIMGFSHVLNSNGKNTDIKQQDILEGLCVSVKKLDDIIADLNHILQVRRQKEEQKEMVSFADLVSGIKSEIGELINKENAIILTDFSETDQFYTQKNRLYNILHNLIIKSIKYKQPGVSPVIEIQSRRVNNKIEFSFKDNGKGIDLKKNGKDVFGLYKRFDTTVEGKGTGLYMLKTEVGALGGKVTIRSEPNKGAEFKIAFLNEEKS